MLNNKKRITKTKCTVTITHVMQLRQMSSSESCRRQSYSKTATQFDLYLCREARWSTNLKHKAAGHPKMEWEREREMPVSVALGT